MAERGTLDLSSNDPEIVLGNLRMRVRGRLAFVFGSRATGRGRRRSDLDLAVGGGLMSLSLTADPAEGFDQSDLPITVDVVEPATAAEAFRARIERDLLSLPLQWTQEIGKELVSA